MTHRSWLKFLSCLGIINIWRSAGQSQDLREDNKYTSTLGSKSIFNGHFYVIESDVGGASGWRITGLDRLGLNAFNSRNQNDSETIVGLATCGETAGTASKSQWNEIKRVAAVLYLLVGIHAASNPLLGPVNNPVLPVLGLLGIGLETKHVRSGVSLRNGETNKFPPRKDFGEHLIFQFLRTEIHDRRKSNDQTTHNTCTILFSLEKARALENPDRRRNHGHHNGRSPGK